MKKGIIVLLIAVLISGFAFAGTFHGSASIEFGVDFDEHTWGFANKTAGKEGNMVWREILTIQL